MKLGDVYELRTRKGLAYIQYVLQGAGGRMFVRVLPGFYETPPGPDIAVAESQLLTSYPLDMAVKQGQVRFAFPAPVPDAYRTFPVMRAGGTWLWDGTREWQERSLTPEQERLPHRTTRMHANLVGLIEAGVADADLDDRGEPRVPVDYPEDEAGPSREREPAVGEGNHYLYFAKEKKAKRAQKVIEGFGHTTTLRPSAQGDEWLLLVALGDDVEAEHDLLERIAEGNDGEYDGWEARVG